MPIFTLDATQLRFGRTQAGRSQILTEFAAGIGRGEKFRLRDGQCDRRVVKLAERIDRRIKQVVARPHAGPAGRWRQEIPEDISRGFARRGGWRMRGMWRPAASGSTCWRWANSASNARWRISI